MANLKHLFKTDRDDHVGIVSHGVQVLGIDEIAIKIMKSDDLRGNMITFLEE